MKRACVIFNPAARGHKARHFRQSLITLGSECTLKPTPAAGAGRALAAEAVRQGFEVIVAAGGDGTLNEVLNGIADEPNGLRRACLGVLPLGTVNVFATELGLPSQVSAAWEIIRQGREVTIDVAEAGFTDLGKRRQQLFAQLGGAGLDSRAVELVDLELKKRIGRLAYLVAGMKAMHEPHPQVVVEAAGKSLAGDLVLIGNGRLYGGRFPIFPLADMRDGLLDVTVFPRVTWAAALRSGLGLLTRRLHTLGGTLHLQTEAFTLRSSRPLRFELDGENVGPLPAQFSVRRQALRVLVP